jgi:hypothetical protein
MGQDAPLLAAIHCRVHNPLCGRSRLVRMRIQIRVAEGYRGLPGVLTTRSGLVDQASEPVRHLPCRQRMDQWKGECCDRILSPGPPYSPNARSTAAMSCRHFGTSRSPSHPAVHRKGVSAHLHPFPSVSATDSRACLLFSGAASHRIAPKGTEHLRATHTSVFPVAKLNLHSRIAAWSISHHSNYGLHRVPHHPDRRPRSALRG